MAASRDDPCYGTNMGKLRRTPPGKDPRASALFQSGPGGRTALLPLSTAVPNSHFAASASHGNQYVQFCTSSSSHNQWIDNPTSSPQPFYPSYGSQAWRQYNLSQPSHITDPTSRNPTLPDSTYASSELRGSSLTNSYPTPSTNFGHHDSNSKFAYTTSNTIPSSSPYGRGFNAQDTIVAKKGKFNAAQLRKLTETYKHMTFPSTAERMQLAKALDITPRNVQIWFQNRRQSMRHQARWHPSDSDGVKTHFGGLDNGVGSSGFRNPTSVIETLPFPVSSFQKLVELLSTSKLLESKESYQTLLGGVRSDSQKLINAFRTVLMLGELEGEVSYKVTAMLLRLSRKLGIYPECLVLQDLQLLSREPITEGGFGAIWKATLRGRAVSIKVAKINQTSDILLITKAFSREAILWSTFSHPNVLPFYGMYYMDNNMRRICLVSPWMENGNLVTYLEAHPAANRNQLALHTILGLQYLHKKNVVHGDLKGVNILVTSSGRACLADFGLSTILLDPKLVPWTQSTTTRGHAGSIRWQAPELFGDAVASKESDVYALACVFVEIFTGKVPFADIHRDGAVILAVAQGKRPDMPRTIPESVQALMHESWRGEPNFRPTIDMIWDEMAEKSVFQLGLSTYAADSDLKLHSAFRVLLHSPVDEEMMKDVLALVSANAQNISTGPLPGSEI